MCFYSWASKVVDCTASKNEKVFLFLFHQYSWSILFYLVLFLCLMVGDFLWRGLLLFYPVALVSVHHFHESVWWVMGLWTSKTPMLPCSQEQKHLCVSATPVNFSLDRLRWCALERGAGLFVTLDNDCSQLSTLLPLPLLPVTEITCTLFLHFRNYLSSFQDYRYSAFQPYICNFSFL